MASNLPATCVPSRRAMPPRWYFTSLQLYLLLMQLCIIGALRVGKMGKTKPRYEYDLAVIGGGAAGLMAAGTAASLGSRVLLIDAANIGDVRELGGDCTNAACVPSKSLRAVAAAASTWRFAAPDASNGLNQGDSSMLRMAGSHVSQIVDMVRSRESFDAVGASPGLEACAQSAKFVGRHTLQLWGEGESLQPSRNVTARRFIICTGAKPVIPPVLADAVKAARLPLMTYRDVLGKRALWRDDAAEVVHVAVIGGGPCGCELAQSLARLGLNVTMIAPALLRREDASVQEAMAQIMEADGVEWVRGRAVGASRSMASGDASVAVAVETAPTGEAEVISGKVKAGGEDGAGVAQKSVVATREVATQLLVCACGRSADLEMLDASVAGAVCGADGLLTNARLRCLGTKHVYAAGDVVAGAERGAHAAGWMGFQAARNAALPWCFGGDGQHPNVPRVVYTDPEVAIVGMSRACCERELGRSGFDAVRVEEATTDRGAADSFGKSSDACTGFVELRVRKRDGRIVGCTAVSARGGEIACEASLMISSRMSALQVARALHPYPSYGYTLYRCALAAATSSSWGLLRVCGPIWNVVGAVGLAVSNDWQTLRRKLSRSRRSRD